MEMKWHPIVNGDLSGIQQQETLLFTIFDERQNENYVTTGWILENEGELEVRGVDPWGLNSNETKKVKAWMELPSPFHPNDCNMCAHYRVSLTDPEKEYLDLICEIQHNAIKNGGCHVGSASDWCIFGKDIKAAIESLHMKRHSGNTFV